MIYLDKHIELILESDIEISVLLNRHLLTREKEFRHLWAKFENLINDNSHEILERKHREAFDKLKIILVKIQEKDFVYSRIRSDWNTVIKKREMIFYIFNKIQDRLENFIQLRGNCWNHKIYGGVKPEKSITAKLDKKRSGNTIQENVVDIWDVVRFRIVVPDIHILHDAGVFFWEHFFDDILRCRNYYYRQKYDSIRSSYRAIHFELVDKQGNICEVQIMTKNREAISMIDHPFSFKRLLKYLDGDHADWLSKMSLAANIVDATVFDQQRRACYSDC